MLMPENGQQGVIDGHGTYCLAFQLFVLSLYKLNYPTLALEHHYTIYVLS